MSLASGANVSLGGRTGAAGNIKRSGAQSRITFDVWTVLAFLYPLSQLAVFNIVGQLYLMDLLALPLLATFLTLPDAMERLRRIVPVLTLIGVWLLGQVITDLVRETSPGDFLRGWAKIVFFALQLATLWLWLPRRRAYFAAFAIGLGVAAMYSVPPEFVGYEWKFGYDRALIYITLGGLFFLSLALPRLLYLAPVVLLVLSFFLLLQSARSAFGVLFIAAVVVAAALVFSQFIRWRQRLSAGLFAGLFLGGILVATGATTIYGAAVENGLLGREALVKYRDQTSGEVPLLLGGRTESLVATQAIIDSPVIGHGSWARDARYVALHHAIKVRLGLPIFDAEQGKRDLIPTHSHLFGAWVEAGIAGGIFWLWTLSIPIFALFYLLKRQELLAPLVAYCAVAMLWSVLFNPFGSTERFFVAFQLALLLWTVRAGGRSITLFAPVREALRSRKDRDRV
ncbi:hypothetical protein [Parerythrobacter aestuarii]|uniref:hypothetical protein n=1 Tax=Parerythrobacter aestuarii TaxID=3020909 RepID=UPI0024DE427A|nr:hypothetical protein [Parerythrobacter aestuarii]